MLISKINIKPKIPTKQKNGGTPPKCPDERLRYVTAACGDCYECRKQKQRQWIVRMSEENRYELGKKGLGIEEQKLVKDIILGMLEIASKGAGAALGAKVGKTGFQ